MCIIYFVLYTSTQLRQYTRQHRRRIVVSLRSATLHVAAVVAGIVQLPRGTSNTAVHTACEAHLVHEADDVPFVPAVR